MTEAFDPIIAKNTANAQYVKPGSGIEVIGAGFSKSGTMSLYAALAILGYRSYHMLEVFGSAKTAKQWHAVIKAKEEHRLDTSRTAEWLSLLEGYNAGVDAPFCDVYDDLANIYPSSKVILSVRDPEKWFNSMNNVMGKHHWFSPMYIAACWWDAKLWNQIHLGRAIVKRWISVYGNGKFGPEMMQPRIDEVKASIPPERLLVFDVKQGWEPLCKFLGKPIPDEPFPNVNDGPTMIRIFRIITAVGMAKWFAATATLFGAAYAGWRWVN